MEKLNGIKKCNRILAMTCAIILFMSSIMPLYATDDTGTTNWDKTLFVGDSITVGLGQTCNLPMYMANVGDSPSQCLDHINNTYSMPEESQVDKVVLMIGVNNLGDVQNQVDDTKNVIEKLQELYPDKTIYVQGILPRAENGGDYTNTVDNQKVTTYNEELKSLCEGITNAEYIDTSSGLVEDVGGVNYLKEEYSADGLHLKTDGYKKLLENIDNKIRNGGIDNSNSSIAKKVSPYKMTIAINEDKRVFELTYSKYNEERAEELKEQFEKRNLEELYNKILEQDKEDGIDYKDNNGRLAILASFIDNGLDVTQLTEDLIEMLPEFIKAELLSTYPDIREKKELTEEIKWDELNIGEFQGIVRLKRKHVEKDSNGSIKLDGEDPIISDKSEEYLEYIKKEDFDKLKSDKKEEILDYFTMDKDCSYIIVGKVSKNNGDVTISEQKINYRPTVNNFAMSFELLEAFYAVTKDTKLIKEMTDLAYGGTIEIAVLEEVTVTDKTTKTITEVAQGKIIKKGDVAKYGDLGPFVQQSETYTTERNISTTYSLRVDKADTWVCSMEQLYKPKYKEEIGSFGEVSYGEKSFVSLNEVGDTYYETRQGECYKTDVYKVKWKKDGEAKEHIKIKDDDGKWEGLLAVLGRKTLFTGKYVYADSISSIYSADLWIFGMLEDAGSSTAQVNLIKYMFYEFFGEYYGIEADYGVTEPPSFDELFGSLDFKNQTRNNTQGGWSQFIKYMHGWENSSMKTYNINGVECYEVLPDRYGSAAVGFGVDTNKNREKFIALGYTDADIAIGSYLPVDVVDKIEKDLREGWYEEVEAETVSLDLEQYQIFALVSRAYNMGTSGALKSNNHTYEKKIANDFVDSYNKYWTQDKTEKYYGIEHEDTNYDESLYKEYMCVTTYSNGSHSEGLKNRRESEWILFSTGRYYIPGIIDEVANNGFNGEAFTDSKGRTYTLYKQNGSEYKTVPYPGRGGGATIGANGCGPVSCTIISSGYGYTETPPDIVSRNYSNWDDIMSYFKERDFEVTFHGTISDESIKQLLKDDYKIVMLAQGGYVGSYNLGSADHWITLLDVDGDEVFVGDSLVAGGGWFDLTSITSKTNVIAVKK